MNYTLGVLLQLAGVCCSAFIFCSIIHDVVTEGRELNAACHEATKELAYPAVLFAVSLLYLIICAVSDVIKHM